MLQDGGAWSGVRATEMLRHIAKLHAHPLDVDELGERVGLGDCGRTPYRRLSGGQQQRLKLAMAIVGRPELVFVDEPTAGMDPAARRTTWELLQELRSDGVTVVLTTHHMDEAERLADQLHIIDRGRSIASGTPLELTRGGTSTIRLVVTKPFPAGAPESLRAALGQRLEVTTISEVSLLITGPGRQHHARHRLALVRGAGRAARVAEPRPAHARGHLPRAHRTGARAVTTSPRQPGRRAARPRQVLAQASMEARLLLRNGEQLLLAVVIPVIVLIGAVEGARHVNLGISHRPIDEFAPGVLALAVMSTAFTSLAIATGFERRYGVLKRLGSSPLPRSGCCSARSAPSCSSRCSRSR